MDAPPGHHFIAISSWELHSLGIDGTAERTAPEVHVPATITVAATSPVGAAVRYIATARDDVDGALTPTCTPRAGATFSIGTTTVTCTVADQAGNTAAATFKVTVKGAVAQI